MLMILTTAQVQKELFFIPGLKSVQPNTNL